MSTLDEIARRMGTDKSSLHHGYTRVYERILQSWRDESFVLLEIGVRAGASLRTWREYFSRARVVGIDRDHESSTVSGDGVEVHIGDQADGCFLVKTVARVGRPRVIIDDGSHRVDDVVASFSILFPMMEPGGVYVIEDTTCSYSHDLLNERRSMSAFVGRLAESVELHGLLERNRGLTNGAENFSRLSEEVLQSLTLWERWVEELTIRQGMLIVWKRGS